MNFGELAVIPRSSITIPERYRKDYGDVNDLAESIKGPEGLICPIAVRTTADGYALIAGGRRLAAIDKLGWTEVPCRVYNEDVDAITLLTIELVENLKRKSLTWEEEVSLKRKIHEVQVAKEGKKYSSAPDAPGHSIRDTAKILKESHTQTAADIDLANALDSIPELRNAKSKSEAVKLLTKAKEKLIIDELAKRQTVKTATNAEPKLALHSLYVVKDFFEGVQEIEDGRFHLVEIDPPYGIDFTKDRKDTPGKSSLVNEYNEIEASNYPAFLFRTFKECYRVMAPDSWLICWFAFDPWAFIVWQTLTDAGFTVSRRPGIWVKPSGMCPAPSKQLASDYESFYYARKGDPGIRKEGRGTVFNFPPVPSHFKTHPTERPVPMIQEVLSTFAPVGSNILVPFAGSGNTLLAAANLKMNPLGFDLSRHYRNCYVVNVSKGEIGQYGSYK